MANSLQLESYREQQARWPANGKHIMAQFDEDTIFVYQAYRPSIGRFAAVNGFFGGPDFSFGRMSWIKPNFLWMMYRSGWGTKPGQEVVLAVRLYRRYFDELLARAVHSSFDRDRYPSHEVWSEQVQDSDVRLQWDPDHDPSGAKLQRRAIQLGLRSEALAGFRGPAIDSIADISELVATQRQSVASPGWPDLATPIEHPYPVADDSIRQRLGLS
jgi:hypothetical protein